MTKKLISWDDVAQKLPDPVETHLSATFAPASEAATARAAEQKINGVTITGTPTTGQVPTATSGTASTWQSPATSAIIAKDFAVTGVLVVGTGKARVYNDSGRTLTFIAVRASVGTAPTGATLICDVNKGGTTIFGTQANRPTIAIGGFTVLAGAASVTTWAVGEYLTVDCDQTGSTVAGSDLTVTVTAQ